MTCGVTELPMGLDASYSVLKKLFHGLHGVRVSLLPACAFYCKAIVRGERGFEVEAAAHHLLATASGQLYAAEL